MKKAILVTMFAVLGILTPVMAQTSSEYPLVVHINSVAVADGGQGGMIFADITGDSTSYVFLYGTSEWRLNKGTYHGKWNKNGSLELLFVDGSGKSRHQKYTVLEEN
jgi:hypothetical protein